MTVGVVVSCYRQERFMARTVAALERALEGQDWRGVLEFVAPSPEPPVAHGERWRVIRSWDPATGRPLRPLTPGAGRLTGLQACPGEWVLFVDSDVELEREWLPAALACAASGSGIGGVGGRIEEWFVNGDAEWRNRADMYRVGDADRPVEYLAALALYRRDALLAAGGYDPRLNSDEDFELAVRLRGRGLELRALARLAGRHWSPPRPTFAELARRWRTGLLFGQGQVLRLYLGRRGFGEVLRRQWLYLATLGLWGLGAAALVAWLASGDARALQLWALLPLGVLLLMTVRKRSPRLALHSLATWTLQGVGLLVGLFRTPGTAAAAPAVETAC